MELIDKNRPAAAWIAGLRARFPCEREIDRVLTRKLERRAGAGFTPLSLAVLADAVRALIAAHHAGPFSVEDCAWLGGGASKIQMAFTLAWTPPGALHTRSRMVLRMEPAESIIETSRIREFQLLRAMAGQVPVPPVYWVDGEGAWLPYPGLVYGFVAGVTKPANAPSQATGMGTYFAPEWRAPLGAQFVAHLARIHTVDIAAIEAPAFDVPANPRAAATAGLATWERVWEEDADEDIPLLRLTAAWLHAHVPTAARLAVVHGDYRTGNFLFTEHDARITALLDWEMARIGDPHQDLAWATAPAYGHVDDAGRRFLVGGFLPEAEFFARYEEATGFTVEPKSLHYYRVYTGYMQGVIAVGTAWRIARNGKTHQDALLAWIVGIGSMLLDDLRRLLEQGA